MNLQYDEKILPKDYSQVYCKKVNNYPYVTLGCVGSFMLKYTET